jgi:hypothetical protein
MRPLVESWCERKGGAVDLNVEATKMRPGPVSLKVGT